jgi:hypothetical protein
MSYQVGDRVLWRGGPGVVLKTRLYNDRQEVLVGPDDGPTKRLAETLGIPGEWVPASYLSAPTKEDIA